MSRDRGSGTVLVAALLVVVAGLASAVAALGHAVLARHRAEAAADLAALAAAGVLAEPFGGSPESSVVSSPCRRADAVAIANGARLQRCDPVGDGSVTVQVTVPVAGVLARWGPASATARAGPPDHARVGGSRGSMPIAERPADPGAPTQAAVSWAQTVHTVTVWPHRVVECGLRANEGERPVDLSVTSRPVGDRSVVSVVGEVDVYTAPRLRERLSDLVNAGEHHLVVDLSGVDFLDSTGLGVLVGGLNRVRGQGGSLTLVCGTERILKVLRITGLTGVFPIHAELHSALSAPIEPAPPV